MPQINCNVIECQHNKPHRKGLVGLIDQLFYRNIRRCEIDTMLSIDKGKCEYWDSYQEDIQIKLLKIYEEAHRVVEANKNV
jgi:hypothetical protein